MTLVEAFRQLRSNGTAAKLWIVGTGTVAHQLQEQAQACGFAEDITFHGLVKSGDDLRQLYRQADVFALGSYHYETQGLVLLEAAAAGLPIVYSDERLEVGVTKANSLRTPPDSKGYAQGFRQLCEDHALRRRMGLASLSEARAYPLDKVMTEIQAVYTQAIQKPAKAA
jgi:glycosyltransferase involved in cell wall biosynthesis